LREDILVTVTLGCISWYRN